MIGEKVGHIKATMAKHLATVMDAQRDVRLEGTIPRAGNAYTLPLVLDFYSTNATDEHARNVAATLQSRLRGDHHFRLAQQYRAASSSAAKSKSAAPTVVKKKLDWNSQQKALDDMFDNTLKEQYTNLPNVAMSSCLQSITLLDYQIQGIKWLLKKETEATPPPFYKKVKEKKQTMYLCEITQSSQSQPPKPICGSVSMYDSLNTLYSPHSFYKS